MKTTCCVQHYFPEPERKGKCEINGREGNASIATHKGIRTQKMDEDASRKHVENCNGTARHSRGVIIICFHEANIPRWDRCVGFSHVHWSLC
jgi:hypothetical protein